MRKIEAGPIWKSLVRCFITQQHMYEDLQATKSKYIFYT